MKPADLIFITDSEGNQTSLPIIIDGDVWLSVSGTRLKTTPNYTQRVESTVSYDKMCDILKNHK